MSASGIDLSEEFAELGLRAIRDNALTRADELGCTAAEVRVERIRTQALDLHDTQLEAFADDVELGVGIRVLHDGAFGFAASVELDPAGTVALVERAVAAARSARLAATSPIELAPEPGHGEVTWSAPYERDPTEVPLAEKLAVLGSWSEALLAHPAVAHVTTSILAVSEEKFLASLSGTTSFQRRVRLHPSLEVLAPAGDGFETMRTLAPPAGRGWEYLEGVGWNFAAELAELPELLAEKLVAPTVHPGNYDLVIDPSNLWLTIHESVGHATELDRALGYEAAYAGTSFATFDQLGTLQYGSELMTVTGDRTTPYGLASIGYDDEGVAAQRFDLVRDGVLAGYQLDRKIAAEVGFARSNGCAYGSSPLMTPIQRMANVSLVHGGEDGPTTEQLIAGVEHGIYVVGDKSWSIDMQRHNFQFTGQRFYRIESGRLVGQLRDVAYQSRTTEFWGSLAALGGASTYLLAGAFNCGKGQPGQAAPVSHGCPAVVVTGVRILNTKDEAGA